jgi:hypothetical protein
MKKILLVIVLSLMTSSFVMSQSYIGEKYENFFNEMINKQLTEYNNYMFEEPTKETYNDKSYNISFVTKNKEYPFTVISVFSFNYNNICTQIINLTIVPNKKSVKMVMKTIKKQFNKNYRKFGDYWIEEKDDDLKIIYSMTNKVEEDIYGVRITAKILK